MKVRPIYKHGEVIGINLMWDSDEDKAKLLRGLQSGMSAWGDRPKWCERLLDLVRGVVSGLLGKSVDPPSMEFPFDGCNPDVTSWVRHKGTP